MKRKMESVAKTPFIIRREARAAEPRLLASYVAF